MDTIRIQYCFRFPDASQEVFDLALGAETLELVNNVPDALPEWTALDFCQCPICPLHIDTHPHCPLALNLVDITKRFSRIVSYEKIGLDVFTEERNVSRQTTAQKGLSSLMGVLIAASGCPHTVFFKPMARFHLPLATQEETMFRAVSSYLLGQYFRKQDGKPADFDLNGLRNIYQNIEVINKSVARRLRIAITADSSVNAIVILDMFAKAFPHFIDKSWDKLSCLFEED
jgi:hypothetical protein